MKTVLIVGLGGVGQRHVRNLRLLLKDDIRLIAYRSRGLEQVVTAALTADRTKTVEDAYGIEPFTDLSLALKEQPEIAFICSPSSLHIETALHCAKAGCDLFIEKPIAHTLRGVQELIRDVEERSLIGMVGYQLRYHPCLLALKEILGLGALGEILAVRAVIGEYLPNWHPYEDYREMYAARADLGGGVVLSQIHEMDYLYSLFGLPSALYAVGGHWSHLEIDVEDTASTLMSFPWKGRSLPISVHQDYLQDPPNRQCEVIGDRARAVADFRALTFTLFRPGKDPEVQDFSGFDRNQMFVRETEHFLECVDSRTKPIVDLRDGLQSLRMALAVKESLATGRLVQLEENEA